MLTVYKSDVCRTNIPYIEQPHISSLHLKHENLSNFDNVLSQKQKVANICIQKHI